MQSYMFSKLSSMLPPKTDKSHTAAVSKEISFNKLKPTSPRTNEEIAAFHVQRHKIIKKAKITNPQSTDLYEGGQNDNFNKNKYAFCNLFKINQVVKSSLFPQNIPAYHPININIQNININNIHYHNGSSAVKKAKENTREEVSYFPIITAPNVDNTLNRNTKENKKKFRKIRLVDLDKLRSNKQPIKEEKEIRESEKKTILSNKKIEVVEDNNESFFDELADLLLNVEEKATDKEIVFDKIEIETPLVTEANEAMINNNNNNINYADINRVNAQRPQTSYGGLTARKKSMQNSLRQKSSKQSGERLFIQIPMKANH